ncbi:Hypothetical predicted protein [Mytilus galloprovincialis]|uniref:Uncharacterized protein n=1 Tax=Mytilus galloprovincialis TaxID=29158 RepID=A0A8B6CMA2_MYTGA|nr:Hypothetical predicted protein [Mytilus galloprovincialis]
MYAIFQWSDKGSGLLNLDNVTGLKRGNVAEYKDGDYIYAMYGKHKYRARISEKNEDKSYLQTLEKDKTFPVEYEYDSDEAEVYEDTFIEGGVNRGQNATAAVSKPVGVK